LADGQAAVLAIDGGNSKTDAALIVDNLRPDSRWTTSRLNPQT